MACSTAYPEVHPLPFSRFLRSSVGACRSLSRLFMHTRDLLHLGEQTALFGSLRLRVQQLHVPQILPAFWHGHLIFSRHALAPLSHLLL
jgi:hypothetical protein